jgi:hypothetical protein
MNYFAAQVRNGETKAVRTFLLTVRRSATHKEAWSKLGLKRTTFYALLAFTDSKGHTR